MIILLLHEQLISGDILYSRYFSLPRRRTQGISFIPMVVESFGGWGDVAIEVVQRLAASLSRQTGRLEEEVQSHTWRRLEVTHQRVNGQILANRQPYHLAPMIDGSQ